jgi:hypothetical protein
MKILKKILLSAILISSFATADYVPGKVVQIVQNGSTVAIYINRTDNNTVIHRNLPSAQEKNMLALLLTAMASDKPVSCNVNGGVFDKCIVYAQ